MTPPTLKSTLHLYALNLQSLFISELYLPPPAAVLFVIHNQDNIFLFIFSILLPFWASLVSRSFFFLSPGYIQFLCTVSSQFCPTNFYYVLHFLSRFLWPTRWLSPPLSLRLYSLQRNLSNQSHVVLQSVPLNISGKFTCEISVEAPTFQTAMVSGEMEVVGKWKIKRES